MYVYKTNTLVKYYLISKENLYPPPSLVAPLSGNKPTTGDSDACYLGHLKVIFTKPANPRVYIHIYTHFREEGPYPVNISLTHDPYFQ